MMTEPASDKKAPSRKPKSASDMMNAAIEPKSRVPVLLVAFLALISMLFGCMLLYGILYAYDRHAASSVPAVISKETSPEEELIIVTSTESEDEPASEPKEEIAAPQPVQLRQAAPVAPKEAKKEEAEAPKTEDIRLSVPHFKQQYTNSCEAASLRMALAFYGVISNDYDIVLSFGYAPKEKDVENNIWDDPHKMFVGSLHQKGNTFGYGVYGEPVAKAALSFGRTSQYVTRITPKFLADEIRNQHPVVIWGYTSLSQEPYTWTTPEGKTVTAFRGEHARVLVGARWKAGTVASSDPEGFYVHDPLGGAYEYWDSEKLMAHMSAVPGVTDQAVAVR